LTDAVLIKSVAPLAYQLETAARVTDCSTKHLRREISAGRLAARKMGRRFIIERAALESWIAGFKTIQPQQECVAARDATA
jgi:excisionase family DNA binding protein